MSLSRRRLLRTTGAAGTLGLLASSPAQALDRALRETSRRTVSTVSTAGTTLESVAAPTGTGFRRLTAGPGSPLVVRPDLAAPQGGRDDRRTALTSFVQFTDLHVVDAQSPARVEYVHPFTGSAHRPQETLSTQGATSLVRRVNSLPGGPYTGRAFDFVLCTGDNTDNHEKIELEWFLTVLNGGTITPDTGDPARFEGVQNSKSKHYWNPGYSGPDMYKDKGFPQIPGLLENAVKPFTSPGLNCPWYSVFGNHDDSVQGTFPSGVALIDAMYTGTIKIEGLHSEAQARRLAEAMRTSPVGAAGLLLSLTGPIRLVTPDSRRRPFTPRKYVAAHLDPRNTGPGPVGHGFGPANAAGKDLYYTFPIAPGVAGIGMDTTNRAGPADGSLGDGQFKVWVNGHTHRNQIIAHQGGSPDRSFWEINTASHTDYPHHARIIELTDNGDGTLSLFTTLIEAAAPYATDFGDGSPDGLASLYREIAFNDIHADPGLAGQATDHNTELLLTKPFRAIGPPSSSAPGRDADT